MSVNFLLGKIPEESSKFKDGLVHWNQHEKLPDPYRNQPNRTRNNSGKGILKFSFLKFRNNTIKFNLEILRIMYSIKSKYIRDCSETIHVSWISKRCYLSMRFPLLFRGRFCWFQYGSDSFYADSDALNRFWFLNFLWVFSQKEVDGRFGQIQYYISLSEFYLCDHSKIHTKIVCRTEYGTWPPIPKCTLIYQLYIQTEVAPRPEILVTLTLIWNSF